MDCAYAAHYYWTWEIDEHECHDRCQDQYWDVGFDDWNSPCEGRDEYHWGDDDHWDDNNHLDVMELFADDVSSALRINYIFLKYKLYYIYLS